jgi:hypothetical protein
MNIIIEAVFYHKSIHHVGPNKNDSFDWSKRLCGNFTMSKGVWGKMALIGVVLIYILDQTG